MTEDRADEWSTFAFSDMSGRFDPKRLFKHPNVAQHQRSGPRKRICIVGGGIAGLSAAFELSLLKHQVVVLEAGNRFGGRISTHHFSDGSYGELGAMRIPKDHACVHHYIRHFNLVPHEFVTSNDNAYYYLRGHKARIRDWSQVAALFNLAPGERNKSPATLLENYIRRPAFVLFRGRDEWNQYRNELKSRALLTLEKTSLEEVAAGLLVPGHLPWSAGRILGLSDEGWQYAGLAESDLWIERSSMLHWLREANALRAGKIEIAGGMTRLIDAFVESLKKSQYATLRLGAPVESIRLIEDGVEVASGDRLKGPLVDRFHVVLCTTPASATRRIEFDPPLPARQQEALSNLSYLSAGKTLMRCSRRYWEADDGIYGGRSVTDLLNQQCCYPSDNSAEISDDDTDHKVLEFVGGTGSLIGSSTQATTRVAVDPLRSEEPGVLLAAYMWGTNAKRFASMSDAERDEVMLRNIACIHPQNERWVTDIVHHSWDESTVPGGGAFAWFAPGEQRRYQAALAKPIERNGVQRVAFAGEHVGIIHGWIQSSIQSALVAAINIIR